MTCSYCGRPRLLDTFACEGGAGSGYIRAGYCVTAVDTDKNRLKYYPKPDCPGAERVLGDAIEYIRSHGHRFILKHASPPCQGYSRGNAGRETEWPKLIPDVRDAMQAAGGYYVIENVEDAAPELLDPVLLCGCMFSLSTLDTDGVRIHLKRGRLFEANWSLTSPRECDHSGIEWFAGAYGGARRDKYEAKYVRKGGYVPPDKQVVKNLLGVEHDMTWQGLYECLPPAYTEHIGRQLLDILGKEDAA